MCGSCQVNLVSPVNSSRYKNSIPIQQVSVGSTLAQLYYFRCLNARKFKDAFGAFDLGIETDDDVKAVALMHDSGKDVSMFKQDFLKIAQDIKFTDEEREKAHCDIAFIY